MVVIKKILIFVCLIAFSSCIKEDEAYTYYKYVRIKNTSSKSFKIVIEDNDTGYKYIDSELLPNESTNYYQQSSLSNSFNGFSFFIGCNLEIIFNDNNKGYICGDYPDNSGLCFNTKGSPFNNPNENEFVLDKQERDNVKYYTYEITQEDYENAHILP